MFLYTLSFWVSSCFICGSCFSRRSGRSLRSGFGTISWALSGAPCTWPPSSVHLGACVRLLSEDILLVLSRVFTPSPHDRQGTVAPPAWCECLPCLFSPNGFRKGKEEKEQGTPSILNLALPLNIVWPVNVTLPICFPGSSSLNGNNECLSELLVRSNVFVR